jgi:hypothetical protein
VTNKRLIQIKLLVLLCAEIGIIGCKKDSSIQNNTVAPEHIKISQSLYPFLFDVSSYWIYKDTITNNLDSVTLNSDTKKIEIISPSGPGQGSRGDIEYFDINYFSSFTNKNYHRCPTKLINKLLYSSFRGLLRLNSMS